jgi:hypothetical protein
MLPVDHPDRQAVGGCGGGWWWHSPADTLDKADAAILAKDVEVYLTMSLRMVMPEVIPYNFGPSARDFVEHLTAAQEAAGSHLDLRPVIATAERFQAAADRLSASKPIDVNRRNEGLKRLTRIVNPALFTIGGPYEMDPALQLPVLPGLMQARELAGFDPVPNEYGFLRTRLVRQRNRIHDALLQATELAESLTE